MSEEETHDVLEICTVCNHMFTAKQDGESMCPSCDEKEAVELGYVEHGGG